MSDQAALVNGDDGNNNEGVTNNMYSLPSTYKKGKLRDPVSVQKAEKDDQPPPVPPNNNNSLARKPPHFHNSLGAIKEEESVGAQNGDARKPEDVELEDIGTYDTRKRNKKVSFSDSIIVKKETSTNIVLSDDDHYSELDTIDREKKRLRALDNSPRFTRPPTPPSLLLPQQTEITSDNIQHGTTIKSDSSETSSVNEDNEKKRHGKNMWRCMCCAAVFIFIAIVAVAAIIAVFVIGLNGSSSQSSDVTTIRDSLSLQRPPQSNTNLFVKAWTTSESITDFYLVIEDDIMPWQSPTSDVTFLWHKGSPITVHAISSEGLLKEYILGDTLNNENAKYALSLDTGSFYAASLIDDKTYCLLSVVQETDATIDWIQEDADQLARTYPRLENIIRQHTRT